jgi:hypothetical protein
MKHHGAFVYTSNVDGQFQAAGYPEARIVEYHGTIHYFQCARPCSPQIWPAPQAIASNAPPRCVRCGGSARPTCLLFSDPSWIVNRTNAQRLRLEVWQAQPSNAVVIEIGAGLALSPHECLLVRNTVIRQRSLSRTAARRPNRPRSGATSYVHPYW